MCGSESYKIKIFLQSLADLIQDYIQSYRNCKLIIGASDILKFSVRIETIFHRSTSSYQGEDQ